MSLRGVDNILWTAPRSEQDWRDDDTLAALDWLTSLVPSGDWQKRIDKVDEQFQRAKAEWAEGQRVALFDPADLIARYVHLARSYADPARRADFYEPEGYRIAPVFRRLGQLVPSLRAITGGEERAARLMTDGRKQPDDGIYELLVAGAYHRRGWTRVEFVPEAPPEKRPDLFVSKGRSHWAVECKRAGRSEYGKAERAAAEALAALVHKRSAEARRPLMVVGAFRAELASLPENYLSAKVEAFLAGGNRGRLVDLQDAAGSFIIGDADLGPLLRTLAVDDIHFGSSRMLQLLLGDYDPSLDFSIAGQWQPAEGRPFHADTVGHVSAVVWKIDCQESARRKATHFRGVIGRASQQLPGDRPGVIHVGYEATEGNSVDGYRHYLNELEMKTFNGGASNLRWVYGNYFMPEHTTVQMESAAVSETTACYPIGKTRISQPLPGHLLFLDGHGEIGSHFRGERNPGQ